MKYFGHIIISDNIKVDHAKIIDIINYVAPSDNPKVYHFMGLADYYY